MRISARTVDHLSCIGRATMRNRLREGHTPPPSAGFAIGSTQGIGEPRRGSPRASTPLRVHHDSQISESVKKLS